jgi:hypothetical protein
MFDRRVKLGYLVGDPVAQPFLFYEIILLVEEFTGHARYTY